ncbi:MAG: PadR family transcriptional regulator [Pseudonocardiales bacterium]|nr:PadR family transcriptional regulator [Pseudonocardiales bacterium]
MSATRILVLGVVRGHGQAHGYQVRRELLSWRADAWARVAPGSIYQALRTLTKHGLLEQVSTEAGSGGPERTVYRITPDGETELLHLIRSTITDAARDAEPLNAAFAFLALLGRAEAVDLFHHRARTLWARLVEVEPPEDAPPAPDDGTPPQVAALFRLYAAQIRADIDWSVDLATRIRDGEYAFADDPSPATTNQA